MRPSLLPSFLLPSSTMSELTDEIKSRVINSIQESAHGSTPVNIKDLDKFMLEAVKHLGKSGEGVGISQTSGGGASVTLTITGLKISVDIMQKIARRYFTRQRDYFNAVMVPQRSYQRGTATGQTLGRMRGQDLDGNMEITPNRFMFRMTDAKRSGDVSKRRVTARNNRWREKYHDSQGKPIPATKLQKGKRKGQTYEPKTYNEVAGYIEQRVGKPIFFTSEQEIKEMIVTELIRAMR